MKTLLIIISHASDMHVVTSQSTIYSPISTEWQIRPVHEWFFTNTMSKTDSMALLAKCCWIGNKLSLCGWENEPAPQFLYRSNMAKRAISVISMRVFAIQILGT